MKIVLEYDPVSGMYFARHGKRYIDQAFELSRERVPLTGEQIQRIVQIWLTGTEESEDYWDWTSHGNKE